MIQFISQLIHDPESKALVFKRDLSFTCPLLKSEGMEKGFTHNNLLAGEQVKIEVTT